MKIKILIEFFCDYFSLIINNKIREIFVGESLKKIIDKELLLNEFIDKLKIINNAFEKYN